MSDTNNQAAGRPGLNLSKMIRLDQVEDIMNSMVHRLDTQEATIVDLQKLCSSLLSKNAANDSFEAMQDSMRSMEDRLDLCHAAATSNIGAGRDIPAGELAYLNHVNLQKLSAQVAACARTSDVSAQIQHLQDNTEAGIATVRTQATPAELGESLRRAQIDISKRQTTTESVLSQKVDRSEVGTLENLAGALESYSQFREDTEVKLVEQRRWNESTAAEIQSHQRGLDAAAADRQQIKQQAKLFSTLEGLEEVATALRSVTGMTNLCAAKKTVNELYEIVRGEQDRSSRNEQVVAALGEQAQAADTAIATKASIEDNKKNVLRRHYDEAIRALGGDLDTKASKTRVAATDGRVAILEAELADAQNRLAVAMRFVEWFTSRGENYEHNLRLVDKHLGKLANAADPKERSPYTGQVRFAAEGMPTGVGVGVGVGVGAATFGGSSAANLANMVPWPGSEPPSGTSNIGTSFSHLMM